MKSSSHRLLALSECTSQKHVPKQAQKQKEREFAGDITRLSVKECLDRSISTWSRFPARGLFPKLINASLTLARTFFNSF